MLKRLLILILLLLPVCAQASPIYVYKEADGTLRFTSKKPPASYKASVYTSKAKFSRYRGRKALGLGISRKIGKHVDELVTVASGLKQLDCHAPSLHRISRRTQLHVLLVHHSCFDFPYFSTFSE